MSRRGVHKHRYLTLEEAFDTVPLSSMSFEKKNATRATCSLMRALDIALGSGGIFSKPSLRQQ
jgi:hypothetical protein